MSHTNQTNNPAPANTAVIFDLDGVLTDTVEMHFQSWMDLSRELKIPFDRAANDRLRGLSRTESLKLFLGQHAARFSSTQQAEIMARKNERYLERITHMQPDDALPGARALLQSLRQIGVKLAVASSSKNARPVVDRLGLGSLLDTIVDGNDIQASKPDPQVFLVAAQRLGVPPARCIVVEDAESGVAAALSAGMKVIGIGPPERVSRAHHIVTMIAELQPESVLSLLGD